MLRTSNTSVVRTAPCYPLPTSAIPSPPPHPVTEWVNARPTAADAPPQPGPSYAGALEGAIVAKIEIDGMNAAVRFYCNLTGASPLKARTEVDRIAATWDARPTKFSYERILGMILILAAAIGLLTQIA